jgi:hypothetical protein
MSDFEGRASKAKAVSKAKFSLTSLLEHRAQSLIPVDPAIERERRARERRLNIIAYRTEFDADRLMPSLMRVMKNNIERYRPNTCISVDQACFQGAWGTLRPLKMLVWMVEAFAHIEHEAELDGTALKVTCYAYGSDCSPETMLERSSPSTSGFHLYFGPPAPAPAQVPRAPSPASSDGMVNADERMTDLVCFD